MSAEAQEMKRFYLIPRANLRPRQKVWIPSPTLGFLSRITGLICSLSNAFMNFTKKLFTYFFYEKKPASSMFYAIWGQYVTYLNLLL